MKEVFATQIDETRRVNRQKLAVPEFIYAEFIFKGKSYALKIVNLSKYGLGMIVTHKEFDLLNDLKVGDTLKHITFYATWTMINVDGIVRHKTKILNGKYQGCYVFGIESYEIIDNCRSANS